jgi:hypothetical protein
MPSLLFYEKPVALNKVTHKDIKIAPLGGNFSFAAKTNSVIMAGIEFAEAAKEYPVVFAKAANERIVPVALLGMRNSENLFVGEDGKWDARYIPAFVRRYPFVLAQAGERGDLTVCIDQAYAGYNAADGQNLFDENGQNTPLLQRAVDFLTDYQRQYRRTEAFIERLNDAGLLMSLSAKVNMKTGKQFALTGFMVVDEKKLLQVDDETALKLFRAGELAWVYSHLLSLSNLSRLVDRVAGQPDRAPTEEGEAVH